MAELLVYREHDFPSDIECQAMSFVRIEWFFTFSGAERFTQHLWRGWNTTHFVIVEQGVLISYAAVIQTSIELAGTTYITYGLSSMFTYPSFRGEGYGRQVVKALTRYIQESDADLAILWCEPRLAHFYGQSGWIPMEHVTVLVGARNAPTENEDRDHVMMTLFVSDKGQAARQALQEHPVYVGEVTW